MKKVVYKQVDMALAGQSAKLDYKEQLLSLLLVPQDQEKGTNYEEMAIIVPIHAKMKASEGFVFLEDAEHKELVKRVKDAKFRQNSIEVFQMIQDVIQAPDHLVEAASK
jgi:hypothetical protein